MPVGKGWDTESLFNLSLEVEVVSGRFFLHGHKIFLPLVFSLLLKVFVCLLIDHVNVVKKIIASYQGW